MKSYFRAGVLFLILLLLSGCGGNKETPAEAVANAFEAISTRDIKTAQKYFSDKEFVDDLYGDVPENEETLDLLFQGLECQVLSSAESDDTAIVSAKITNIDMGIIFHEYLQRIFLLSISSNSPEGGAPDEDEMAEYFLELLKRENNAKNSTVVDIKLNRSGNSWILEVNDELENAIMGDLAGSMSDMFY